MAINKYQSIQGISIIELLIVIAIVVIALTSILGVTAFSLKISIAIKKTTQANALAQHTIESVRNFRDGTNWNTDGLGTLITNVAYYPQKTADVPPKWSLILGEETINGFIRKVIFQKVSRSPSTGDIEDIYNPNNDDPNTRKAMVTVSWEDKEIEIATYLANWR